MGERHERADRGLGLVAGFPLGRRAALGIGAAQGLAGVEQPRQGLGDVGERVLGAAALDLADVAAGRFDGFWEQQLSAWDIAAGSLLIREAGGSITDEQQVLLDRYVDAFARYDIDTLVTLLHDDCVMSMPPYDFWLQGTADMYEWFTGHGIGTEMHQDPAVPNYGKAGRGPRLRTGLALAIEPMITAGSEEVDELDQNVDEGTDQLEEEVDQGEEELEGDDG